jgi:Fe-S oxidoreductase
MRIAQRSVRNYTLEQDYSGLDISAIKESVSAEPSADRVLYFAGCMTALTPAVSRAMESVFRKAGVDYAFMDKDGGLCCGRPVLMAGRFDQARQLIQKNKEIIKASGASTLVLSCPICYKIFREHYKLESIRVVHHTQYMLELVQAGKLTVETGTGTMVYHDPCELGRGCGVYEQPRELLRKTGALVEATQNRDLSICCGGSLGSLTLGFDKREDMTRNALDNLTASDPDTIVTACPLCKSTFGRYADRPVEDIAETVDKHSK